MQHRRKSSLNMNAAAFASLGPGQLRPGREVDAVDGVAPQAVITPRSPDHLSAALEEARREGLGIIPVGGATSGLPGNIPEAFHIRLLMTGLATKLERRPADMTVSVDAGVSLARINRALAAAGQRLCLDPPHPERATAGGLVASNACGGLRHAYGSCRDLVLGMAVVDGQLRRYQCGAEVVKNVAGYDLPRLFTGSWGSLAIITEVTFRTHPLPEQAATLLFEFDDEAQLDGARARLLSSKLPLAAADFSADMFAGQQSWTMALRVEGSEHEVAYQAGMAEELLGREIGESADQWWSPVHAEPDAAMVLKVSLPPACCARFAAALASELAMSVGELSIGGHLGVGLVRVSLPAGSAGQISPAIEACRRCLDLVCQDPDARAAWADFVVEKVPPEFKQGRDVWGRRPAGLSLMQGLKQRFDPARILSPGRFVGGI